MQMHFRCTDMYTHLDYKRFIFKHSHHRKNSRKSQNTIASFVATGRQKKPSESQRLGQDQSA